MKTSILLLCLLGVVTFAKGQLDTLALDTFDLSEYQLTDLNRHQLQFQAGLGSNGNRGEDTRFTPDLLKTQTASAEGNFSVFYSFFGNTRKKQQQQNISLQSAPSYRRISQTDKFQSQSSVWDSRGTIESRQRWYKTPNRFIEFDLESNWIINQDWRANDTSTVLMKESFASVRTPVKIGTGRLERVNDARMAVFILKELLRENRISRTPEKELVLEFAALISRIRNERFFDARHKRIYELEQIDSFLQAHQLVDIADARYFTTINDNWGFAINPSRQVGRRFSVGIAPEFQFSRDRDRFTYQQLPTRNTLDEDFRYGGSAFLEYEAHKAINLYWHRRFHSEIMYSQGRDELNSGSLYKYNYQELSARISYQFTWQPTSRTLLRSGASARSFYLFQDFIDMIPNEIDTWYIDVGLSTDLNYYVAPHIRLTANFRSQYTSRSWNNTTATGVMEEKTSNVGYFFRAGLIYSFL